MQAAGQTDTPAACSGAAYGVLLALVVRASAAHAHDLPVGEAIYLRDTQRAISTNRGLVVNREAEPSDYRLLCREALSLGDYDVPSVLMRADGSLLVGTPHGLLRVSADLCELSAEPSFDDVSVSALLPSPSVQGAAYAATTRGLYYTADEGEHFEQVDDHTLDSLVISSGDPERVYGSGAAPSAPGHPAVYFGGWQRGTSFESYNFVLDTGEYGVSLLALQPGPRLRLFAVARAYLGTSQLDRLIVSDDDTQSWTTALAAQTISAVAIDTAEDAWLVATAQGLLRHAAAAEPHDPELLHSGAVTCLRYSGSQLYLCDGEGRDAGVSVSPDNGAHLSAVLRFHQVRGLPRCAADSPLVQLCGKAWADWERELPPDPPPTAANTTELSSASAAQPEAAADEARPAGSCSLLAGPTRTVGPPAGLWLACLLSWLYRRHRTL